jgi:ADP-heptose:LPS heptosyltransferase
MPKSLYHKFRDGFVSAAIRAVDKPLARFNHARLGHPQRIFHGGGGIGDDLLCTAVFRELKKRGEPKIVMRTFYGELFEGNPDVNTIIRKKIPIVGPLMVHGLNLVQITHELLWKEHFIITLCRSANITGEVSLRPYVSLRPAEIATGRLFDRQIVIQSSALGSTVPMKNKEWYPERFQEVANQLQGKASLIQLGTQLDPPLKGALDLRGKTSLRGAAAILANSHVFVGLVGFLMHLARSVDCRSVIVFGGREAPSITGYIANKNLVGATPCSPCWLQDTCDYDRECMKMISVDTVVNAAVEQITRHGNPLETEVANL